MNEMETMTNKEMCLKMMMVVVVVVVAVEAMKGTRTMNGD
jgi:hypothetical protein